LGDTTTLPVRYQWSLNNIVIDTLNHIIIKPTQTTIYVLQTKHCSTQTQTITITVNDCTVIPPIPITEPVIPNVFTPNGDGINDTFNFSIVGASNINFNIYNRWGNIIQNSTLASHTYISWDGRTTSGIECASGIYFYTLQYTDAKGDLDKKNGYITLIK
jgi:gliding motility-associated-like protein